ncbi:MAG: M48 family metalloprotease [Oxalobacteraceae bacterium]
MRRVIVILTPLAALLLNACSTTPLSTSTPPIVRSQTPAEQSPSSTTTSSPTPSQATPERDAALEALMTRQARVYRIAAPLITKNAVLCRTQARPLLGFTAKNVHSYPSELAGAARQLLALDERLQVMQVLDGSGAQKAGMIRGDILQTIQDIPIPEGAQAESDTAKLLAPVLKNLADIRVRVLRRGQAVDLQVPLTLACAFAIDIGNAPNINAYADGRRIMLTRGLLDALPADDDVAVIIARELAHNVLQHARQLQQTATIASVIDKLLALKPEPASYAGSSGIKPLTDKMDQEADRLAMFMLARAGYDPLALSKLSQRLADTTPANQMNSYSALHPWTEERRQFAQAAAKELRQKQKAKKPLVP